MKLDTVLSRLTQWYQSGISIYLTSPPGMGKTTTIVDGVPIIGRQLNKNLGLVVVNGGNLNEMDVQGYLVPRHHETYSDSLFTKPFWWTTADGKRLEEYDGGIIFVDEADKTPVECKKVLGEGAESGRLGSHVLPGPRDGDTGWRVWMAGNRADDRSGSTKELDHLINRRMEVPIMPDMDSLINWMSRNGVTPMTQAFTSSNAEVVLHSKVPEKQGPWCTPRSLVKADRYMQLLAGPNGDFPTDPTILEELNGLIGEAATRQYQNTIRLAQDMPKFSTIIASPDKVKVPERPDAQMLVCFELAHKVDKDTAAPVIKYVDRFPKEFAVTFTRAACNRNPKLVTEPAFNGWCLKNASLMAIITAKK
ncbi:MAG: ATP-binding protein [Ktedonobacterales bacterium]